MLRPYRPFRPSQTRHRSAAPIELARRTAIAAIVRASAERHRHAGNSARPAATIYFDTRATDPR